MAQLDIFAGELARDAALERVRRGAAVWITEITALIRSTRERHGITQAQLALRAERYLSEPVEARESQR